MLVGTDDPQRLAEGAPEMPALDTAALELPGVVFLQALFEIESGAMCEMLPPALHPTLPPVAGVVAYDVPESPWGPFRIAQLRVQCRSGLRPRALLVSAVVDVPEAGEALARRFGFRVASGEVRLERAYDETRIEVAIGGADALAGSLRGPMRIGEADTQFVSCMHPARTPRGYRLVQVDTRHAVQRAARAQFEVEAFDGAAWGEARIRPTLGLPGVVGLADLTLDTIRFLCRPDVMAFEGSESVGR